MSQGSSTSTESYSPYEMPLPVVQPILLSSTAKSGGQYPQAISPIPYAPSHPFDPICSAVTGSNLSSSEMELNSNTQQSSSNQTTQQSSSSPKVDVSIVRTILYSTRSC